MTTTINLKGLIMHDLLDCDFAPDTQMHIDWSVMPWLLASAAIAVLAMIGGVDVWHVIAGYL